MKPERIIWLDDEAFIIKAQRMHLHNKYGYNIDFFTDVNEFINSFFTNNYDFIILDVMMLVEDFNKNRYITFTKGDYNDMDDGMNTGCVIARKICQCDIKDKIFERNFEEIPILFYSGRNERRIDNYVSVYCRNYLILRKPQLTIGLHEAISKLYKSYALDSYIDKINALDKRAKSFIELITYEINECGNVYGAELYEELQQLEGMLNEMKFINGEFISTIKDSDYYDSVKSDMNRFNNSINDLNNSLLLLKKKFPEFPAEIMNVEEIMFKNKLSC